MDTSLVPKVRCSLVAQSLALFRPESSSCSHIPFCFLSTSSETDSTTGHVHMVPQWGGSTCGQSGSLKWGYATQEGGT